MSATPLKLTFAGARVTDAVGLPSIPSAFGSDQSLATAVVSCRATRTPFLHRVVIGLAEFQIGMNDVAAQTVSFRTEWTRPLDFRR